MLLAVGPADNNAPGRPDDELQPAAEDGAEEQLQGSRDLQEALYFGKPAIGLQ